MTEPSTHTLEKIDPEKQSLKKIPVSKQIDYLKGSIISSSTIFFKLECENWEEFIQFLEPIHRFDLIGKSPTMPITINTEWYQVDRDGPEFTTKRVTTFTALSGMSWPTLLTFSETNLNPRIIEERKKFLEDCGYVVIKGKVSFFKGE